MSRVRNTIIKRAGKDLVKLYFSSLSADFENNKRVVNDVAKVGSKKIRNQLAGCATRLFKRIQRGTVKNIFIKKHEEEREKRENMIPTVGIMDTDKITVDPITLMMLEEYNYNGNYAVEWSEEQVEKKEEEE